MADLAALQFPVESSGVVKAAKDLDGLSTSAAKAGGATDKFVAQVQKTVGAAQRVSASNAAAAHSFDALYDAAQRDFSGQWAAGAAAFTRANDNMREAVKLNGMQIAELGHITRSIVGTMMMGGSAFQAFGYEANRIASVLTIGQGGVGVTLKALGTIIGDLFSKFLPLIVSFGTAAVVLGTLAAAFLSGRHDAEAFAAAIKISGDYAGVTTTQLETMARQLGTSTKAGADAARQALVALVQSGQVSGDALGGLTDITLRLAQVTGQSGTKIAGEFAKMGDDVAGFAEKFNGQYHLLTAAQLVHIRMLQQQGDAASATMALIVAAQQALADRTPAQVGIIERAWDGAAGAVAHFWQALKSIGNDAAEKPQQIAAALERLQIAQRDLASAPNDKYLQQRVAGLQATYDGLIKNEQAETATAKARAQAAQVAQQAADAEKRVNGEWSAGTDNLTKYRNDLKAYKTDLEAMRKAGLDLPSQAAQAAAMEEIRKRDLSQTVAAEQKAAEAAKQREKAAENAFKSASKAAGEYIARLQDEIAKVGQDEEAQRRLQDARAIEKAPLDRQKELIALLADEREAVIKTTKAWDDYRKMAQDLAEHTLTDLQRQQAVSTRTLHDAQALDAGGLSVVTAATRLQVEATTKWTEAQSFANVELVKTPKDLAEMAKELERSGGRMNEFADSVDRISRSIDDMGDAFRRGDFIGGVDDLTRSVESLVKVMGQTGSGSLLDSFGSFLGSTGSEMAAIFQAGSSIGSALSHAFGGNTKVAKIAGGLLGGLPGFVLGLLTKKTPSNFTASADFGPNGVSFGGDKPNDNTTQLIQQLAQVVQQGEAQLRAMGLTLGATISSLAIGQRDTSKIHLSNGQTIEAPAGDPTAAAEAALKAVLSGATFVDSAEKTLVDSMLDAGKGFDQVTAAMQTFTQAQAISSGLADQILQLQDPRAFDLQSVVHSVQQQRTAAQQMADQGFLTADQLSVINGQLDSLAKLQLDQVMGRYAQSVADATKAQEDALAVANDNVSAARDALGKAVDAATGPYEQALTQFQSQTDAAKQALSDANQAVSAAQQDVAQAYQRQAGALQDTIDRFTQLAQSLGAFNAQLATSTLSPGGQYAAARRAFLSTSAAAAGGDETALGALQPAVQAFLDASKGNAPDRLSYVRDVNQARAAVSRAQAAAQGQASIAQQQLSALTTLVSGVIDLGSDSKTVSAAMADLKAAQDRVVTATDAVNGALHDEALVKGVIAAIHAQYDPLVTINASVLTIPEAIAGLQAALQAQAAAQAALNAANASAASAAAQAAAAAAAAVQAALGQATAPPAAAPDTTVPANFDVPSIVAGIVGGGGDTSSIVQAINELRSEQKAANLAIAKNTRQTSELLDRVTQGDTAIRTTAA
jgi:hypothetical protein